MSIQLNAEVHLRRNRSSLMVAGLFLPDDGVHVALNMNTCRVRLHKLGRCRGLTTRCKALQIRASCKKLRRTSSQRSLKH
jgi:hypothetical protein